MDYGGRGYRRGRSIRDDRRPLRTSRQTALAGLTADAGVDSGIWVAGAIELNGSHTGGVGAVTGLWTVDSGAGTFDDDTSPAAVFTPDSYATCVLRWTVTDSVMHTAFDTVTIRPAVPARLISRLGADLLYLWVAGIDWVTLDGADDNDLAEVAELVNGGTADLAQADSAEQPFWARSGTNNGQSWAVLPEVTRHMVATIALGAANRASYYEYGYLPKVNTAPNTVGYFLGGTRSLLGAGGGLPVLREDGTHNPYRSAVQFTGGVQNQIVTAPANDDAEHLFAVRPAASGAKFEIDGVVTAPGFAGNDTIVACDTMWMGNALAAISMGASALKALVVDSDANNDEMQDFCSARYGELPEPATIAPGCNSSNTPAVALTTQTGGERTHFGSNSSTGKLYANMWDVATQTLHPPFELYDSGLQDAHRAPAFLERASDGRLLCFYATGADFTDLVMRVSTNPGDSTSWGAAVSIKAQVNAGGTDFSLFYYPKPFQMPNGDIYLFCRKTSNLSDIQPTWWTKSTDGGATWSAGTICIDNPTNKPYVLGALNTDDPERIDFFMTDGHPILIANNNVYHAYFDTSDETWHQSDGTLIAAPPFAPSEATQVYDGASGPGMVYDVCSEPVTGAPIGILSRLPSRNDVRYLYARWDGAAWVVTEFCASRTRAPWFEAYIDSGKAAVDNADPGTVYACKMVAGQLEVWKYVTADEGATFDAGTALTSNSQYPHQIPRVPIARGADVHLTVWYGALQSYITSRGAQVLGFDGDGERPW